MDAIVDPNARAVDGGVLVQKINVDRWRRILFVSKMCRPDGK